MNILDKLSELFAGEPARVIGYGGAAILFVIAKASGSIPDLTAEEALLQAGGYVAIAASFVEAIRHFVTPVAKPNLPA